MEQYAVTPELVRHVGKLAALDLDSADEARFADELNRILGYMKQLESLDTNGLEATFQTIPISNVMREDRVSDSLSPARAMQNAPEEEEGFFRIPPILE